MLILSRKVGEAIVIGDNIQVVVTQISERAVRLGIAAPADTKILRKELKPFKKDDHDPKAN